MDAVATCAPAQDHDSVSRLRLCWMGPFWQQPNGAAEDKRIAQVTLVVNDRAVDCRQAKLVGVVADSGHDAVLDAGGMKNACWQFVGRQVLGAEAEHVCAGDWPGRNGDDVAYDAADAGICPAKGFESGWVIVCFYFECQIKLIVKFDDAGIVDKGRTHPGTIHMLGRRLNICGQQPLYLLDRKRVPGDRLPSEGYARLECFVDTVLAPGLGKGFQFDVGGGAADLVIETLDLLHLLCVKREHSLPTAIKQTCFVQSGQGNLFDTIAGVAAVTKKGFDGAQAVALDCIVAQQPSCQPVQVGLGQFSGQAVLGCGCSLEAEYPQLRCTAFKYPRGHVGHAWTEGNFNDMFICC